MSCLNAEITRIGGDLVAVVGRVGGDLVAVISPVCGASLDDRIATLMDSDGVVLYGNDNKKLLAKI